ncbi:pilus assembly protein TadG [Paeniglutamicibacter sp. ABSL32-1]|uniref:pilus assembly protein TadG-related protein n=1 Tax=Paeniglutamicibacter quisquiliarum TaxID=2849498 RepID=UPI001C2D0018|nr:pilus assembly protein TadG-related protein [Paeniglutamicibacter quisquiliarum]MBV1779100.1 pilus assembly protein TadG [Paeniglutamicibacter quisquiliarum]
MRRLTNFEALRAQDREHGATAIIVALLMVVLLGFAAISIDVGKLYWERAQLQNGADAGALALAQVCAKNESDTNCGNASGVPLPLAEGSSSDSLSLVTSIAVDKLANKATVATGASEAGATPNNVSLWFAQFLDAGLTEAQVDAQATATWGGIKEGTAGFPLALSECSFILGAGGAPGPLQLVKFKDNAPIPTCTSSKTGAQIPGGFGYLDQTAPCEAYVDVTDPKVISDPGMDPAFECSALLTSWHTELNQPGGEVIIKIPVFDDTDALGTGGSGNAGWFHIKHFAAFSVKGWKFSGTPHLPQTYDALIPNTPASLKCTGDCRGIWGQFISFVDIGDDSIGGGPSTGGLTKVWLSD